MAGERLGFLSSSSQEPEESSGQGTVLALVVSVICLAALGLTLVWMNIERTKLAYRVRTLQQDVDTRMELNAKLSVEREHLLSPQELGRKAEILGLHTALPGQIRRMEPTPPPPATPAAD